MSTILPWRNWYHCMGNTFGTWLPGDPKGFRSRHHEAHVEGDYHFPPPPGYYDGMFEQARHMMPRDAVFVPRELRALVCQVFADALRYHKVEIVELSVGGVHWHLLARFVPVGVDPYKHLEAIGVKLTHPRKRIIHPHESPPAQSESPPAPAGGNPPAPHQDLPPAGAGGLSGGLFAYDHDPVPRRLLGLARTFVTHKLKELGHFSHVQGGLWALRPKCDPAEDRRHQVAIARYIRRHADQHAAVLSLLPPSDDPHNHRTQ
ncbi:MAG: hypothetical protein WD042_16930 [Phycisphaeraceae bacterium]